MLFSLLQHQGGGRTDGVGQNAGAGGHLDLPEIGFRHAVVSPRPEAGFEGVPEPLVHAEVPFQEGGHGSPRNVVGGRTQATRDEDRVASLEARRHGSLDLTVAVSRGELGHHRHAQPMELPSQPRAVGVDGLAQE